MTLASVLSNQKQVQVRICRATCKPLGTERSYLQTDVDPDSATPEKHFVEPSLSVQWTSLARSQPSPQTPPHWQRALQFPTAGSIFVRPPLPPFTKREALSAASHLSGRGGRVGFLLLEADPLSTHAPSSTSQLVLLCSREPRVFARQRIYPVDY